MLSSKSRHHDIKHDRLHPAAVRTGMGSLTWEIRSVNHRYLETSIRLPDIFRGLENQVRERVRKAVSRGKVECQLRYTAQEIPAAP